MPRSLVRTMIRPFKYFTQSCPSAYIDESAQVIGDVVIGAGIVGVDERGHSRRRESASASARGRTSRT